MDTSAQAYDDFYQYANGTWLKNTQIPAKNDVYWLGGTVTTEENQKILRGILESAAQNSKAKPGSDEQFVGDLFASCMNTAKIEAAETKTVRCRFQTN